MAKSKNFNNLCKQTLELLASLHIVDDYIGFLYIRRLSLINFIKGVLKVLNSVIVSTFTYNFSCKDTCGHYAIAAITP